MCAFAQKRLYKDEADFTERGAGDRKGYRAMYNSCHGPLRWFRYGDNELHVDIRFLDKIMSAYFTERIAMLDTDVSDSCVVEGDILKHVFEIENWTQQEATDYAVFLDAEIETAEGDCENNGDDYVDVTADCRDTLETISKWKWRVKKNTSAEAVYARIYEHARQHETAHAPAAAMLCVRAVEHHRRYTLRQCPSGEC